MSAPSRDDIIKLKIAKAMNSLSAAEKMLEYNFTSATLNRLYYACFYAATALLFSKDIFTKTHSGFKQMLGLHFISTGILSRDLRKFYAIIFDTRISSDYDDFAMADDKMVKAFSITTNEFALSVRKIFDF